MTVTHCFLNIQLINIFNIMIDKENMIKLISKRKAKHLKSPVYFTGKPCKRGHIDKRYTSNSTCVRCCTQYNQKYKQINNNHIIQQKHKYRKNNKEQIKQYNKQYRNDNKEQIKKYLKDNRNHIIQSMKQYNKDNRDYHNQQNKIYYQKNKEKKKQYYKNNKEHINQLNKQHKKDNPDKVLLYTERRAKYLKEYTPKWYESNLIKKLYLKRNELNKKWNLKGKEKLQVDHIIPIVSKTVCGLHCWANLQLINAELNNSKKNNYQQDW